jgi:hypothetical protein
MANLLRKVKNPQAIRNLTEQHEQAKEVMPYPQHPRIAHKVANMHEGHKTNSSANLVDPYNWLQNPT